jgi:hypothetical protein
MAKRSRNNWFSSAILIGTAAYFAYQKAIGPWLRNWGAHQEESQADLPGDELVPGAMFNSTRAVTIQAQPAQVWPWIVQMGQGRGGLYSYDFLENLMGLNIHSADCILPEFNHLEAGDTIPLEPAGSGYTVHTVKPEEYLLLYTDGQGSTEMAHALSSAEVKTTWLFLLREMETGCTRLIIRWRASMNPNSSLYARLMSIGLEPIEFVMERKMLLGIRQRAEKLAREQSVKQI